MDLADGHKQWQAATRRFWSLRADDSRVVGFGLDSGLLRVDDWSSLRIFVTAGWEGIAPGDRWLADRRCGGSTVSSPWTDACYPRHTAPSRFHGESYLKPSTS
jgi:hypothetical protein